MLLDREAAVPRRLPRGCPNRPRDPLITPTGNPARPCCLTPLQHNSRQHWCHHSTSSSIKIISVAIEIRQKLANTCCASLRAAAGLHTRNPIAATHYAKPATFALDSARMHLMFTQHAQMPHQQTCDCSKRLVTALHTWFSKHTLT